jgi:hypothetical protein
MARAMPSTDQEFEQVLEVVGYSDSTLLFDGRRWQVWNGTFFHPSGQYRDTFIFLRIECALAGIKSALEYIGQLADVRDFMIVLQDPTTEQYAALNRAQPIAKCTRVLSARELLYNTVKRAVRQVSEADTEPYFVEPDVLFSDSNDPTPSIFGLARWLRGTDATNKNVAVLLAPAGSGKTTLVKHVFSELIKTHFAHAIPLLVERTAWGRLQNQETLSLHEVWRSAVNVWYPDVMFGFDQLEKCLAFGAVCPIFDGLDELCTVFPWEFNPDETLRELLATFNPHDGAGRLLITSRSSFWTENISPRTQSEVLQIELNPFNQTQRTTYVEKRFPDDKERQDKAFRILSRIESRSGVYTLPTSTPVKIDEQGHVHRLEYLPYVVTLAAESADTDTDEIINRYGSYLSSADPLRGILFAICDRERVRQSLVSTTEQQVAIFEALTREFGESFEADEIRLVVEDVTKNQRDVEQFKGHAFLQFRNGRYYYTFPFLADYLRASALRYWLEGQNAYKDVVNILLACAKQSGSLLDGAAQLILATAKGDWIDLAKRRRHGCDDPDALCGFFHLVTVVAKAHTLGSRKAVMDILLTVFGNEIEKAFDHLYLTGSLSNLDLRGVTFRNCILNDIEFTKCIFDDNSIFAECEFKGRLLDDSCDGFGAIIVTEDCKLSAAVKSAFQNGNVRGVSLRISKEQVIEGVHDLLRRFMRGQMAFVTRRQDAVTVSATRIGPFGNDMISVLEYHGVLEPFQSSGSKLYRVGDTREVRLFIQNNLATGKLRTAIETIVNKAVK